MYAVFVTEIDLESNTLRFVMKNKYVFCYAPV